MTIRTASASATRFLVIAASLFPGRATLQAEPPAQQPVLWASVFILDDLSGEELLKKHGINATTQADVLLLLDGAWQAGAAVQVRHLVIDEDSTARTPSLLKLVPFDVKRPAAPATAGSLKEIDDSRQAYLRARAAYQREAAAQNERMKDAVSAFIQEITGTQFAIAQRFDAMLERRKGRDFNRSDVAGAVCVAGRLLGGAGARVLILNTDCVDAPGSGKPRRVPFTRQELDAGTTIIFVNQSRIPDRSPLFKDLKNPREHADTMQEAMTRVVALLGSVSPPTAAASTGR